MKQGRHISHSYGSSLSSNSISTSGVRGNKEGTHHNELWIKSKL